MTTRSRRIDATALHGRALTGRLLHELRVARLDRDVSEASLSATIGLSASQYSRIERGMTKGLRVDQAVALFGALGLDLSIRAYPAGEPIRDAAHAALIARLTALLPRTVATRTEVPFPRAGDLRAWDVVISGQGWRHAFEAETRPTDRQALERRLELKRRDGGIAGLSLVLLDSRHNRAFVQAHAEILRGHFPVPPRDALSCLRAGRDPGAGSILLL